MKYSNHEMYAGNFKDGEPHESGEFTYSTGDVY